MRLRNVKNKASILGDSTLLVVNPSEYVGKWNKVFENDNPIYIEIGMGKGNFIMANALKYPDINFIGIEKYDSVIARAIQKIESLENVPKNLRLIRMDARNISSVFNKEIDRIFLNFSDPWPKNRHSERRLTSKSFLKLYDFVFKDNCEIIMKTDNISLFAFSLETLSQSGYILEKVSLDLHNSDVLDNIMTEYERRFSEEGVKINYLIAKKSV